jgi:hypothetical protein
MHNLTRPLLKPLIGLILALLACYKNPVIVVSQHQRWLFVQDTCSALVTSTEGWITYEMKAKLLA